MNDYTTQNMIPIPLSLPPLLTLPPYTTCLPSSTYLPSSNYLPPSPIHPPTLLALPLSLPPYSPSPYPLSHVSPPYPFPPSLEM